MPLLSKTVLELKRSGIREIMDLSANYKDVFHLEVGEPLFDTPDHIIEAAYRAAKSSYTKYTPNNGLFSLREASANRLNREYNLSIDPENIVITVGAVGAISSAVRALVDYGEEVLIPDPGWPNYEMIIRCAGAIPKRYELVPEHNFLPSIETLEKVVSPKTKILILNSPSNPLGIVYPPDLIQALVNFAKGKDIFIISDEVYEKIMFDGRHTSILEFMDDDQAIGIFGFSKTYAMTGWRVGYAVAAKDICVQISKLQEAYVSCACSVSQKAAEAAILSSQDCVEAMRKKYQDNMLTAKKILEKYGIDYLEPKGAFYLWMNVNCEESSIFARKLLERKKVAVAPGTTFGPSGRQYIRISLASPNDSIREGLKRIVDFINGL